MSFQFTKGKLVTTGRASLQTALWPPEARGIRYSQGSSVTPTKTKYGEMRTTHGHIFYRYPCVIWLFGGKLWITIRRENHKTKLFSVILQVSCSQNQNIKKQERWTRCHDESHHRLPTIKYAHAHNILRDISILYSPTWSTLWIANSIKLLSRAIGAKHRMQYLITYS